jgi:hypothetical protein
MAKQKEGRKLTYPLHFSDFILEPDQVACGRDMRCIQLIWAVKDQGSTRIAQLKHASRDKLNSKMPRRACADPPLEDGMNETDIHQGHPGTKATYQRQLGRTMNHSPIISS